MQRLKDIIAQAESAIGSATDLSSLDRYRIQYLGKKSELTEYLKTLGQLPPAERPLVGQQVNAAKEAIRSLIDLRDAELKEIEIKKQLAAESIDVTLPGRSRGLGSIHP